MTRAREVIFRVDAAAFMGSGHLRRCLTLANQLRDWGLASTFVCARYDAEFNTLVIEAGHALVTIDPPHQDRSALPESLLQPADMKRDADATARAIAALAAEGAEPAALVIDHYGLDARWHIALRERAPRIVVIDDLGQSGFDCDVLVMLAPVPGVDHAALVPEGCRCLLGPRYALLRPEFAARRDSRRCRDGHIGRVLVAMGAIDADDHSGMAIDAVRAELGPEVQVDVVLSSRAPMLADIDERARNDPRLTCHVDTARMAELMDKADLAIGAGGTTAWERASMGLPAIIAVLADNQKPTAAAVADAGAAVMIASQADFAAELRDNLRFLSANAALVRSMARAAGQLVDGDGARRVAAEVASPVIRLTAVSAEDSRMIWEWRNTEPVRATAIDPNPIAWEEHQAWLERRLLDGSGALLLAWSGETPVGVLRFDVTRESSEEAEVSIYLAPGQNGRGLGRSMLSAGENWLRRHRPAIEVLKAKVRHGNAASLALFRSANYQPQLFNLVRRLSP